MTEQTFQNNLTPEEEQDGFNFREIFDAFVLNWYWFAASVGLCVLLAFVYLRYQSPVYVSWMKVLIKEDDSYRRAARGGGLADFSQLGLLNNSNGFDNEVEILGSKMLAKRAVTNLKLYVRYAYKGRVRNEELYGDSPLLADMSMGDLDTLTSGIQLRIESVEGRYHIEGTTRYGEFETDVRSFPARVKTPCGWVALTPNPGVEMKDRTLLISLARPSLVADSYAGNITIEPTNKTTTIALVSINDTKTQRAEDYLNELIRVYNEDANEVKNEVALKTEAFINKRISIINNELGSTESRLENFKKSNQLVDLNAEAASTRSLAENYRNRQIELQTQMMLVKSLKDYVDNSANYMEIIPANLGVNDAQLNRVITEYNEKVMERNRLLKTAPETSPVVKSAANAIAALYPGIRHSLSTVYDNLQVQKRNVDEQYTQFMARLSQAPTQERVLADIGRQQAVKAALYQILLQKREENAISLASTVDKAMVVDLPESSTYPISPKRKIVLLVALVLGLVLPAGVLYLGNLLRFRIEGRNDIEKLTSIPVLSDIFVARASEGKARQIVVRENANDAMGEAFRNLRTNLSFVMKRSEKVLICTSVMPGEGKTFVATNFAMSMALLGRKVVVVGLDIRKPRLAKLFGLRHSEHGLTTYLAGEDDSDDFLRRQIMPSGIHACLDVLPAGLIPPNPGELISSKRLDQAFALLREWYDFVVVDTPPLGLVSDTLLLGRLADATLVVCRCDYSLKRNFTLINSLKEEKKLPVVNLVLNGVDLNNRKHGYYYGSTRFGAYGHYGSYGRYGVYGTVRTTDRPVSDNGGFISEISIDDED